MSSSKTPDIKKKQQKKKKHLKTFSNDNRKWIRNMMIDEFTNRNLFTYQGITVYSVNISRRQCFGKSIFWSFLV